MVSYLSSMVVLKKILNALLASQRFLIGFFDSTNTNIISSYIV